VLYMHLFLLAVMPWLSALHCGLPLETRRLDLRRKVHEVTRIIRAEAAGAESKVSSLTPLIS